MKRRLENENSRTKMTFDELVEYAGQQVVSSFWDNGKEGFKSALHLWMGQAIVWKKAQDKMKKEVKK